MHAGLPLKTLLALDARLVVGAGWDGHLRAFGCKAAGGGPWIEVALPPPAAGALRSSKGSGEGRGRGGEGRGH